MAHMVICKQCGKTFDRDKIEAVAVKGRRYVHKDCYDTYISIVGKEEQDLKELEDYIKKLFDVKAVPAHARKQIEEFKRVNGYSYSSILKTLVWWYEVRQNSTEKANKGIGIVPYVYDQAYNYYYTIHLAEMANSMADMETYNTKIIEVEIESPQVKRKIPKLFNLEG